MFYELIETFQKKTTRFQFYQLDRSAAFQQLIHETETALKDFVVRFVVSSERHE